MQVDSAVHVQYKYPTWESAWSCAEGSASEEYSTVQYTVLSTFATHFEAFNVANTQNLSTFATSFMFQFVPVQVGRNQVLSASNTSWLYSTVWEKVHMRKKENILPKAQVWMQVWTADGLVRADGQHLLRPRWHETAKDNLT